MSEIPAYESAESASPAITRLVAGVLGGTRQQVYEFAAWERLGMHLLNQLPIPIAQWVIRKQFGLASLPPDRAARLTAEGLAEQRLMDYQCLGGRYPVIVMGAALAGAAAHIASILRAPFLPQPFILGLRSGSPDESLDAHLAITSPVAEEILTNNPGLMAIAHFDPIHDGWLTRTVSHLRLKLIDLPSVYQVFIRRVLEPGGTILYLDCQAQWMQFPLDERFACQIGGWGGIPSEEFLTGSARIDSFLEASGSPHRGGWGIPGLPPVRGPESEWGNAPGLDRATQMFAERNGYHFRRVSLEHPHDYSRLALSAHQLLYEKKGINPAGILIETFTQYDPYLVLRAGLLPLWLVFNTSDSLEFMQELLAELPEELPVYFSGLATLSRTPDMVPWGGWAAALEGREWVSIGAGPRRYPEDLVALFRWHTRLQGYFPAQLEGLLPSLALEDFVSLLDS